MLCLVEKCPIMCLLSTLISFDKMIFLNILCSRGPPVHVIFLPLTFSALIMVVGNIKHIKHAQLVAQLHSLFLMFPKTVGCAQIKKTKKYARLFSLGLFSYSFVLRIVCQGHFSLTVNEVSSHLCKVFTLIIIKTFCRQKRPYCIARPC